MSKILLSLVAAVATLSLQSKANALESCNFYSQEGVSQLMGISFDETSCTVGNGYTMGAYNESILSNDGENVQILCAKKQVGYPTYYPDQLVITLKGNSGTIQDNQNYFKGDVLKCR